MLGLPIALYAAGTMALAAPAQACPPAFHHLSVPEAEKLVAAWVKKNVKGPEAWHRQPRLVDVSTKDMEHRLKAQVFQLVGFTDSVDEADAYLVHRGKVVPMSTGFGGSGLDSMCVCDLDGDGVPELAFTYSWGSGEHRSLVEVMTFDKGGPTRVFVPFVVRDLRLKLTRSSDKSVSVVASNGLSPTGTDKHVTFGVLTLRKGKKGPKAGVTVDKGLDKRWRDLIWK